MRHLNRAAGHDVSLLVAHRSGWITWTYSEVSHGWKGIKYVEGSSISR